MTGSVALNLPTQDARRSQSPMAQTAPQIGFSEKISRLLDRIDCRLAVTPEDREAIFRLRYEAYLDEGAIPPNTSQRFTDAFDTASNAWIFGLYIDGQLAASIRFHIGTPAYYDSPSYRVFADILDPEIEAGCTFVDPTRFVTDRRLSKLYPGLPYVTVRLGWLAAEYFEADHLLCAIRPEHQSFYRRMFNHHVICEARPYPLLAKPICLMTTNYAKSADIVHRRYPFFRSTYFERRMLFDKPGQVRLTSSPGVAAG